MVIKVKKLLSAFLCALIAATSLLVPSSADALGINDTSEGDFRDGAMVQCGKYILSAVNNVKKNKLRIYRTNLKGKKKKLIETTPNYAGNALLTYKDKVYYRKGTNVMAYEPKTDRKSKMFDMALTAQQNGSQKSKISMLAVCPRGIIYRDSFNEICVYSFDGANSVIANGTASKCKAYTAFLGATDEYIFCYRTEKKSGGRYIQQMYRYTYGEIKAKKIGTFKSVKKPYTIPDDGTFHVFKKKIIFTVGGSDKDGLFEGVLCSMNRDGSGIKTLKDGSVGAVIFPAKSGAYITSTDKKGNTVLNKISTSGKLSQTVKYTDIKYPIISYTTSGGCAVGINVAKTEFGYDLYALGKVKKTTGKRVIKASSLLKKSDYGYVLVSPLICGSVGDLVLVTYGVYRYDNKGYFEKVYRCKSYIVNAKTGKKTLIDE